MQSADISPNISEGRPPVATYDGSPGPCDDPCPHIYFVQAEQGGPIKIGVSVDPERRLRELQTASPYRLVIRRTVPNEGHAERWLHEVFGPYRMEGEWFLAHPVVANVADAIPSDEPGEDVLPLHDDAPPEAYIDAPDPLLSDKALGRLQRLPANFYDKLRANPNNGYTQGAVEPPLTSSHLRLDPNDQRDSSDWYAKWLEERAAADAEAA